MRIAVIGGGVSGLSAAWALSKNNQVVLYEAEPRLGGHANTLDVDIDGTNVAVDAGFIVYNGQNYPNLINLFDTLGVKTELSDMSFSVSIGSGQFEYGGSNRALVAQPLNLLKPFYWKMLLDLKRFYGSASGHLAALGDARFQNQALTIQGFLDQQGYSKAFADLHLLPMAAAIWSSSTNQIRQFPAESFIRFYENHGLFNITNRPKWRTVSGGSRNYVDRIAAAISEEVRIGTPVVSMERTPVGVTVTDKSGNTDHFDQVVLATHADNSLRMLGQGASPLERKVLDGFVFQPNSAIVHIDPDLMPLRKAVWSSWNYLADDFSHGDRLVSLTYWMNPLQNLKTPRPLFISLNPHREPDPETVLARVTYRHPLMTPDTLQAQGELPGIQGHLNTWHCGAWCGYGFHEDGAQAGFAVASALGSPVPWQNDIVPMSPSVDIVGVERLQGVA